MESLLDKIDQKNLVMREWSKLVNAKAFKDNPTMHAYYIVARGVFSKNYNHPSAISTKLRDGFKTVSNTIKLENGRKKYDSLKNALWAIKWIKNPPFLGLSEENHLKIKEMAEALRNVEW
jgi:hypothetical protein